MPSTYRDLLRDLQRRIIDLEEGKLPGLQRTAFSLRIWNDAGTLKHSFGAFNASAQSSPWVSAINGAVETYTATPNGTDASTAFAAGGKISATLTNAFIIDTLVAQTARLILLSCSLQPSAPVTSAMKCQVSVVSRNVNGTTMFRPEIRVLNNTSGTTWAAWALNTTNIASGTTISISCEGYLI